MVVGMPGFGVSRLQGFQKSVVGRLCCGLPDYDFPGKSFSDYPATELAKCQSTSGRRTQGAAGGVRELFSLIPDRSSEVTVPAQ